MMTAPTYDWVCQRCGIENRALVESCAGCGKSAYFKAADLPPPRRETLASPAAKGELRNTLLLFFPEVIPAFALALYGPFWAIKQLASGDVWPAFGLLAAEAVCGYLFVTLLAQGSKYLAHASMLAFVAAAWAAGAIG